MSKRTVRTFHVVAVSITQLPTPQPRSSTRFGVVVICARLLLLRHFMRNAWSQTSLRDRRPQLQHKHRAVAPVLTILARRNRSARDKELHLPVGDVGGPWWIRRRAPCARRCRCGACLYSWTACRSPAAACGCSPLEAGGKCQRQRT